MLQINEAFRKLRGSPGLLYMPTFGLERAVLERPRERRDGYRKDVESRTHLRVTPTISFEGDQRRFTLNADPIVGGKLEDVFTCAVSSETRRVPPEVIGETFHTPAEIFRQFASAIYDRIARDRNQLEVVVSDTKLDPLSDEAVSVILKEVNEQKNNTINIGADPTPIQVRKGSAPEAARDLSGTVWTVELKLIEQAREAKLIVVATPDNPNAQALAKDGLVRLALLPAQNTQNLRSVTVSGPAAGVLRSQSATLLPVGLGLQRLSGRIDPKGAKAFSIVLDEPSILEFDVEQLEKRSMVLLDKAGKEVTPAFIGSSRPNLRRYAMLQGSFILVLSSNDATASNFVLRSRSSRTMLEPEPPGDLTRTFGDWAVGISSAQGRKVCFAYTTATEGSTARRLQRPVIWFSIDTDKDSSLIHFVDDARFYTKPGSARASVVVPGQTLASINLSEIGGGSYLLRRTRRVSRSSAMRAFAVLHLAAQWF